MKASGETFLREACRHVAGIFLVLPFLLAAGLPGALLAIELHGTLDAIVVFACVLVLTLISVALTTTVLLRLAERFGHRWPISAK